jgi:lipoprotein-anchoring transpeptidase ErfK/SrfK
MQNKLLLALSLSAPALLVVSPVSAQSAPPQMVYAQRQVQQVPAPAAYYRQASPGGGGLLEFLFSGAQQSQSYEQQRSYQQQPQYQPMPEQGALPSMQIEQQQAYEPATAAQPEMDPKFEKREVEYATTEPAGTIVIDTPSKFLYLVEGSGRALRYGIGVGKPGFAWAGVKQISMKREWPDWTPPAEMLQRRPDLPRHMVGGPENPLGARAMYLGSSLYRIHGSNEPWTIGTAVSSGCIRMRNEDVIDLYGRVKVGTKVIVS